MFILFWICFLIHHPGYVNVGGPRICIGQRFAMVEMKLAASKLLSRYRLSATRNTRLDLAKGDVFLYFFNEMRVRLEKRDD